MQRDNDKIKKLLKTAQGQIDGIIKMIDDGRYCIDISNQIMASQAILSKVNKEILNAHLHNCVLNSMSNNDASQKLDEIMTIFDKVIK